MRSMRSGSSSRHASVRADADQDADVGSVPRLLAAGDRRASPHAKTYDFYEMVSRLYIVASLGAKRLDRLQVRDVRIWLNRHRQDCQCCARGKDACREPAGRRCCAIGKCCHDRLSERTIKHVRDTLRPR
jgi:hypothetical protein